MTGAPFFFGDEGLQRGGSVQIAEELFLTVPNSSRVFLKDTDGFQTQNERSAGRFLLSDEGPLSLRGGQMDQQFVEGTFPVGIADLNLGMEGFSRGFRGGCRILSEKFQGMEPGLCPGNRG